MIRVIRVLPSLEVFGYMLDLVLLVVPPDGALLLLQAMFLISGKFEVPVLQGALVRTETDVGGGQEWPQSAREIVQLQIVQAQTIHEV